MKIKFTLLSLVIFYSAQSYSQCEFLIADTGIDFTSIYFSTDFSKPVFVDIDNDGDMDAFIGEDDGIIIYYKNTGSPTSAIFSLQSGTSNPLDGDVGGYSKPTFTDIDNDGDMDAFIGTGNGTVLFIENACVSTTASVKDIATNTDILSFGLYPNPAHNEISINLSEQPAKELEVQIFDVRGQLVVSDKLQQSTKTIQLSSLNSVCPKTT